MTGRPKKEPKTLMVLRSVSFLPEHLDWLRRTADKTMGGNMSLLLRVIIAERIAKEGKKK